VGVLLGVVCMVGGVVCWVGFGGGGVWCLLVVCCGGVWYFGVWGVGSRCCVLGGRWVVMWSNCGDVGL